MPERNHAIERNAAQSRPRRRYQRVDPDVRLKIQDLAGQAAPPTAKDIQGTLETIPAFAGLVPPLRTVQAIARGATVIDESKSWKPNESAAEIDPALVLPLLAHVIEVTEGKRRHLTQAEARLVTMVRWTAPGIDPKLAYTVARHYLIATADERELRALDAFLAFAPWSGGEARRRYDLALQEGWVDAPRVWVSQQRLERAVGEINERSARMRARARAKRPVEIVSLSQASAKTTARSLRAATEKGKRR